MRPINSNSPDRMGNKKWQNGGGPVHYRVRQPAWCNGLQIYHISFLNKIAGTCASPVACPVRWCLSFEHHSVAISPQLSPNQRQGLKELLEGATDVCVSDPLGRTSVTANDIKMALRKIMLLQPYCIPRLIAAQRRRRWRWCWSLRWSRPNCQWGT